MSCTLRLVIIAFLWLNLDAFVQWSYKSRRNALFQCSNQESLQTAIDFLIDYDTKFIARQKSAKTSGKSPTLTELEWMKSFGQQGTQTLWSGIRKHTKQIVSESKEVVLGIKAETGGEALSTLRNWVTGLGLPRGVLRAYDEIGNEIPYKTLLDSPSYIKYNSTDGGSAYMKEYGGNQMGVIFQFKLNEEFYQAGDFPISIFKGESIE